MWDLLSKLVSEELYNTWFQKDHTVKRICLTHNDVKEEAGSVDNGLYGFDRSKGTIRDLQKLDTCVKTSDEQGQIVLPAELVEKMIQHLEAGKVEIEIDERAFLVRHSASPLWLRRVISLRLFIPEGSHSSTPLCVTSSTLLNTHSQRLIPIAHFICWEVPYKSPTIAECSLVCRRRRIRLAGA